MKITCEEGWGRGALIRWIPIGIVELQRIACFPDCYGVVGGQRGSENTAINVEAGGKLTLDAKARDIIPYRTIKLAVTESTTKIHAYRIQSWVSGR